MRTHLIRGVLALFVVIAVSNSAAAQSVLKGKVLDASGKPVEGATVTIEATDSNRKNEVKTNRNGEFMQLGLQSGQYNVTAVKDNLKQTLTARITRGAPVELSFQLGQTSSLTPEQIKEQAAMQAMAKEASDAMSAGRLDEAITKFGQIVAKVPTCRDCYYNLGLANAKKGQYAEAEAAFLTAVQLGPSSADAYTGLANIYNAQKKFDQAAEASAQAQKLSAAAPGGASASSVFNQGVIAWNASKIPEAKKAFEEALRLDPKLADAHYWLGMANLNEGKMPEAATSFETYLKLDAAGKYAEQAKGILSQIKK